MDIRESLTMRTVTALQRLADLEEKERQLAGPKAGILKTALQELETALEELRVATEHLNSMVEEMAETRSDARKIEAQFSEFRDLLPIGWLMTDRGGQILQANAMAGDLLNVAPRHLAGKPLSLYMVERDRFFAMLNGTQITGQTLTNALSVRPRERKPRRMAVHLAPVGKDGEGLHWFFRDPAPVNGPA
jgi:PAS domain-containing protein